MVGGFSVEGLVGVKGRPVPWVVLQGERGGIGEVVSDGCLPLCFWEGGFRV